MREADYIDDETLRQADAVPWNETTVRPRSERQGLGEVAGAEIGTEYFVEHVRQVLTERYGEDAVYGGGLRVYTTLDHRMQRAAWDAVTTTLDQPDDPAAALVSVDDGGHVRAMVGGRDFGRSEGESEVNYALGRQGGGSGRQAGSAFKPFVLATAVQQGISVRSGFRGPGRIVLRGANNGADWTVENYGGTQQGNLDLIAATRVSSNTAYAQLMLEVGPQNVVETANRLGITSELPAVNSLVLGTGEVSPYEMAGAFATFARRGMRIDPTVITRVEQVDEKGEVSVLDEWQASAERVMSEDEADVVNHCLQQVVQRGTGRAADIDRPVAGKTGTTQENRDAWFVGFTPQLSTAVWMGYPGEPGEETPPMDNVHGREVTGGSFPAEIWARFMRVALEGAPSEDFPSVTSFPGDVLNSRLTATTADGGTAPSTSSTTAPTTSTSVPAATTTTVAPTTTIAATTTTTVPPGPGP
jgi:penicillin-binding protein 1A